MVALVTQAHEIPHGVHHAKKHERRHLRRKLKAHFKADGNIVITPSLIAQIPAIISFFAMVVMMLYANEWFPWAAPRISLLKVWGISLAIRPSLFAIPPIVVLGHIIYEKFNRRFVLCEDYIIEIVGLLSYTLRTVRLRYLHIRGLEIDRTILQRLLGVGDLRVGGEISPEDTDVVMYGIYNPDQYKNIIKERIKRKIAELSRAALNQQVTG